MSIVKDLVIHEKHVDLLLNSPHTNYRKLVKNSNEIFLRCPFDHLRLLGAVKFHENMYYPIIVSVFQNPLRKSNFSLVKDKKKNESLRRKEAKTRIVNIIAAKKGELFL